MDQVPLDTVAEVITGFPLRKKAADATGGDALALRIGDVSPPDEIRWETASSVPLGAHYLHFTLEDGDILFPLLGSRYYSVLVRDLAGRTAVPTAHFCRIRILDPERLRPEFLAWQLNLPHIRDYCLSQATGTAQRSLRIMVVRELSVAVPPPARQGDLVEVITLGQEKMKRMREAIETQQAILDAIGARLCP